jgi:hypothetical protein
MFPQFSRAVNLRYSNQKAIRNPGIFSSYFYCKSLDMRGYSTALCLELIELFADFSQTGIYRGFSPYHTVSRREAITVVGGGRDTQCPIFCVNDLNRRVRAAQGSEARPKPTSLK